MSLLHTIRSVTLGMPHILLGGVPSVRAGEERLAIKRMGKDRRPANLQLASGTFVPGCALPFRSSADGDNLSPSLRWGEPPPGTKSLAVLVEDPDAPTPQPFVHWLVYNLPPRLRALPEGFSGTTQGKNSMFKVGFAGVAPPKGDLPHHYHFQVFALDCQLPLHGAVGRSALLKALHGHLLAAGDLVGTFARP